MSQRVFRPALEERKLKKKGAIGLDAKGGLLLMDEVGQPFDVSEEAMALWDACDGSLTVEQLAQSIAREISEEPKDVEAEVLAVARMLEDAGLVEFI